MPSVFCAPSCVCDQAPSTWHPPAPSRRTRHGQFTDTAGTASADTESSRGRARGRRPSDDALDAHAEAAVRHRAVPAEIEVPLERLPRQLVLLDALHQQVVVVEPLAAADDLAVAFRREHVDAQRLVGLLRIGLHVERLRSPRDSGARATGRSNCSESTVSSVPPKSPPSWKGRPFSTRIFAASSYADARERRLHRFELRRVALEHLQLLLPAVEHARRRRAPPAPPPAR